MFDFESPVSCIQFCSPTEGFWRRPTFFSKRIFMSVNHLNCLSRSSFVRNPGIFTLPKIRFRGHSRANGKDAIKLSQEKLIWIAMSLLFTRTSGPLSATSAAKDIRAKATLLGI